MLLDPAVGAVDARAEALLMAGARAQHVAEVIGPALAAGRDVVTDRFTGSTFAYQGYGRGLAVDDLRRLSSWSTDGLQPDLNVLLVVSAPLAPPLEPDRLEAAGDEFHDRVADGFLTLAAGDPERWAIVDGDGTVDEVAGRVAVVVEERLQMALYDGVVGQERARGRPAGGIGEPGPRLPARRPTGHRQAHRGPQSFAASLLCPNGPPADGTCDTCRRVLAGAHPDVLVKSSGRARDHDRAGREIIRLAARSPVEGDRKVLILDDFHLVADSAAACSRRSRSRRRRRCSSSSPRSCRPSWSRSPQPLRPVDFGPLTPNGSPPRWSAKGSTPRRRRGGGRIVRRPSRPGPPAGLRPGLRDRRAPPGAPFPTGSTARAPRVVAVVDELLAPPTACSSRCGPATRPSGELGRAGQASPASGAPAARSSRTASKREERRLRTDELRSGWPRWPASTATGWSRGSRRRCGRSVAALAALRATNEALDPQPQRAAAAAGAVVAASPAVERTHYRRPAPARVAQTAEQRTRNE